MAVSIVVSVAVADHVAVAVHKASLIADGIHAVAKVVRCIGGNIFGFANIFTPELILFPLQKIFHRWSIQKKEIKKDIEWESVRESKKESVSVRVRERKREREAYNRILLKNEDGISAKND